LHEDVVNIIRIFTVFQIFLIILSLLLKQQKTSRKNQFLIVFIASKALFVGDIILISHYSSLPQGLLGLLCIGTSFQLLLGPSVYYLMGSIAGERVVLKPKDLFHLIPFIMHLGFIISQYHIYGSAVQLQMLQNGFPFNTPWSRIVSIGFYLHFAIYGIAALRTLSRKREELFVYQSQSVDRNIRFLKFLIYDFIVVWGINVVSAYIPFGALESNALQMLTAFNIFFIANAMVYQGLKFPAIFDAEFERQNKYEKNPLSLEEKEMYRKKITEYMEAQKPFLSPQLSLSELAEKLALPGFVVSQVLNTVLNQNFYDFVNSYRINESKKLMTESPDNEKTILEILYRSGFNSKSVFNAAFKKYNGTTPREFKKTLHSGLSRDIVSIAS
jgi:AraC-like DNA-binding protein